MNELTQIYKLIPLVMADVGAIEKASKNTQQNYKFRGIDDVMTAFQPVLARHSVFFVPEVLNATQTDREAKSGSNLIYTMLTVAYTFFAPDGSFVRAVVVGEAMDSADKSSNKAMSAALKYALLQVFCVPVDAADDSDAHTHDVKPRMTPNDARQQRSQPAATKENTPAKVQPINPRPEGKRGMLFDIVQEVKSHGIDARVIKERIAELCDGESDVRKLSDGDIDGLAIDFSQWLDAMTAEKEQKSNR